MWREIKFSIRSLGQSRGFSWVVILALALGLGVNAASLSVIRGTLLRPVPYENADRIVIVRERLPQLAEMFESLPANGAHYALWKERNQSFDAIGAIRPFEGDLGDGDATERVGGASVTAEVFDIFSAHAANGRLFSSADVTAGDRRVVVVTHGFWTRRLGSHPEPASLSLQINGDSYKVLGVLPSSFYFPKLTELGALLPLSSRTELFIPLHMPSTGLRPVGNHNYAVVARLRQSITLDQARSEMEAIQQDVANLSPQLTGLEGVVTPLVDQIIGNVRAPLMLLQAAALTVLVLIGANLMILFIARANQRRHETAIRVALGSGRWKILRSWLIEAWIVCAVGGLAGMMLAYWLVRLIAVPLGSLLPGSGQVAPDAVVFAMCLGSALGLALLFGCVPGLLTTRIRANDLLGLRGTSSPRRDVRVRRSLIAVQIALTMVVLSVVGALLAGFNNLVRADMGFSARGDVHTVDIVLPQKEFSGQARRLDYFSRAIHALERLPGIDQAAVTSRLPLEGEGDIDLLARDRPRPGESNPPLANLRYVSPSYFDVLGIRVLSGRNFGASDISPRLATPECQACGADSNAILVSKNAAEALWPGETAIGKFVYAANLERPAQVVGVVGNVHAALESAAPITAYLPVDVQVPFAASIVMRSASRRISAHEIRAALFALEPSVPIVRLSTMAARVDEALLPRRTQLAVGIALAGTALLLSVIGVYAVSASSAARQKREIGIRIALGGTREVVARQLVSSEMLAVICGIAIGLPSAWYAGRALRAAIITTLQFGPSAVVVSALLLVCVAFVSALLPILRTTRAEPSAVLREG